MAPLRSSRGFCLVFASRTVTTLGTQASEVALLVQAKQLTGSPLAVGLLGVVELVPLLLFGLYGGVLADRFDRRALMRWCEAALGGCAGLLLVNALLLAAAAWGLTMAGFGLSPDLYVALACLIAAGAADMVSGIFRQTLWNQTIPDALRGRLAGVELLSYGLGPPAGQLRSGAVASLLGTRFSLVSGGLACVGAVALVCGLLPGFVRYKSEPA